MNSDATTRPPRFILLEAVSTAGASADVYLKRHPSPTTARQEFNERKSAQHWFTKSLNLSQSAHLLWKAGHEEEDAALLGVALMLNAMSLELAAKGELIAQTAIQPVPDEDLDRVVKYKHRLTRLLLDLGVSLTPADEDALRALEDYLTWAGRYPLPLKVEHYRDSEAEHGMPPVTVWTQIEALRVRLANKFDVPDPAGLFNSLPSVFLGR